jgi:hypothetical protein
MYIYLHEIEVDKEFWSAYFRELAATISKGAAPWLRSWWVPVIQLFFPLQLVAALLSPKRISWRGHVMQVEKGGGLRIVGNVKRKT